MEIVYTDSAIDDIKYWKKSGNAAIRDRITKLLDSIAKDPFTGIGKPEQLKYDLQGCWSRRINDEHRLVYKVEEKTITVLSMRFHY